MGAKISTAQDWCKGIWRNFGRWTLVGAIRKKPGGFSGGPLSYGAVQPCDLLDRQKDAAMRSTT